MDVEGVGRGIEEAKEAGPKEDAHEEFAKHGGLPDPLSELARDLRSNEEDDELQEDDAEGDSHG